MANKVKYTEMKGTGGGRWLARAEAKAGADSARRQWDKNEVQDGVSDYLEEDDDETCPS